MIIKKQIKRRVVYSENEVNKVLFISLFFTLIGCGNMQKSKIDLSSITFSDTTTCFTDTFGTHCQCDYPLTKKGFITVSDGTKIWIEIEGKGEPLLLIQGGPMHDHRYFHAQMSALASEYMLIYTDFRGRYMSDISASDKYNILQDLEDLEDIRKQLGIEQWNVLGHSFGGFMAMVYATIYPKSVKSAIIVSMPFGFTDQENEDNNTALMTHFKEVVTQEDNIKALVKLNFHTIPPDDTIKYVLQTLYAYGYYEKFELLSANYITNSMQTLEKYWGNLCGETIPPLPIPLLAIAGKQDAVGFWEKTERYFKEKQPNAKFCIFENSAHFPWIEENEQFFSLVKDFLRK